MHIYVDEAGNFIIPTSRSNYISCVVALIIPSDKRHYLFDWFLQLRTSWGTKSAEIKGSSMNEKQVRKVIEILGKYECIVEIFAIGGLAQTQTVITKFRLGQADKLTENIGPEHHPNIVKSMKDLQSNIQKMPNQLFIQSFLLTLLCEKVLTTGTLYWSQRVPKELGEFAWTFDAKDKSITEAEETWRTLLMPFLETGSFSHPLGIVDDPAFDYSHFEKFFVKEGDEGWDRHMKWLREGHAVSKEKKIMASDIKSIFKNLRFADSQDEVGLQLADVVASAFHRACKGTLQREGWKDLGSLFILRRESVVNLIALAPDVRPGEEIPVEDAQVRDVMITIRNGARSMSPAPKPKPSHRTRRTR